MSAFTFRLQSLLRLRESERERKREELAQVFHAEDLLREQLQQMQSERQWIAQAARACRAGGTLDVDKVLHFDRYQLQIDLKCRGLEQQALKLAQEVERRRLALVEADQQVRILEKLRERNLAAFQAEEDRRDILALDEIAGQQFVLRSRQG